MSKWSRFSAALCVLVTTAFQMAAEWDAVPSPLASAPWLDGRPTTTLVSVAPEWHPNDDGPDRLVRFDAGRGARFGLLEGEAVLELRGDLFAPVAPTGAVHGVSQVTLLSPLGPELLGRVLRLDRSPGFEDAGRPASVGSPEIVAPEGLVELDGRSRTRAEATIGMVVGESGRAVFGLTAGILLEGTRSQAQLVLGPAVMRGFRLPEPTPALELTTWGGGGATRRDLVARDVERTQQQVRTAGLERGDVVLLGRPWSAMLAVTPTTDAICCSLTGVGELRCRTHGAGSSDRA